MSHLPDIKLPTFKAGAPLKAADLNAGFTALLNLIEVAMVAALQPDPAGVGNEVKLANHAHRIDALEGLVAMHARQRNERELTPLAYTAAVMQQVRELREPVQETGKKLLRAHARAEALHDGQHERLSRLEQQPEAATQEAHNSLVQEHHKLAQTERMLLAQVIALRHEVGILREVAMGHDREANRREYAPMATVAHLLQRIMELEKRHEVAP
jgi:hypothetical protein